MKHLIAGMGFVGKEIKKIFPDADTYDIKGGTYNPKEIYDFCHINVSTPSNKDGSCDISAVEDVIQKTAEKVVTYICKSTVYVGATDYLSKIHGVDIVFSPEYVASSSPYPAPFRDILARDFFIFGGEKKVVKRAIKLYQQKYPPTTKFIEMTAKEAEITKYMENSFIATYVTFCNEFYDICHKFNADYDKVREGFLADSRMTKWWTYVDLCKRGWGGDCLPKDLKSIISVSNSEFLKDIVKNNERHKK